MSEDCGLLYIAFGERYVREARQSIASLRRWRPLRVAVVTDAPWQGMEGLDVFIPRENVRGWAAKPAYMYDCSPFARTLFVDTDTIFLSDPTPVFGLLDHYDIGVRFGGPMLRETPSLSFHAQCNSGVVLFKKSEAVQNLFGAWRELYDEAEARHVDPGEPRGLNDQRSLSIAIARSAARPVHLSESLNFALFETILTYSPVVILHGRAKRLAAIGEMINHRWDAERDWQARLWLQNIQGILPRGIRRSAPPLAIGLIYQRLRNEMALFFR